MKKTIFLFLLTSLLVVLPTGINASEDKTIVIDEIITNQVIVEYSTVSYMIDDEIIKTLEPGSIVHARTSDQVNKNPLPFMMPEAKFGHVFYQYIITYENSEPYVGYDTSLSYEDAIAIRDDEIVGINFYYSYGGQLTVNYKLDTENGEDLKDPVVTLGRVTHDTYDTQTPSNHYTSEGDTFDIDQTIEGYTLIETIGDIDGRYSLDAQEITLVYEKNEETKTPGTETPGTETPGTETPGTETPGTETPGTETPGTETPGIQTPTTEVPVTETPKEKEPIVKGVSKPTKPVSTISGTDKDVLPATGQASNVYGFVFITLGAIIVLMSKLNTKRS